MGLDAKARHRRLEGRRRRRRYRAECRTAEAEKHRQAAKRACVVRGVNGFEAFYAELRKYNRACAKATFNRRQLRDAGRRERLKEKPVAHRMPLTERRLQLVELSPERAAREGARRRWEPAAGGEKPGRGRFRLSLPRRRGGARGSYDTRA